MTTAELLEKITKELPRARLACEGGWGPEATRHLQSIITDIENELHVRDRHTAELERQLAELQGEILSLHRLATDRVEVTTEGRPVTLRKVLDDWFVLAGDETKDKPCVEGTAMEWREIANAIRTRTGKAHYRCAFGVAFSHAIFWSPKNSRYCGDVVVKETELDALANQIEACIDGTEKARAIDAHDPTSI